MSRRAAVGATVVGIPLLLLAAGAAVARYAVLGRRRPMRAVFHAERQTVVLPRMTATVEPRTFGLQRGRVLYRVGEIVQIGETVVERRIEHCDLDGEARAFFVGDVFGRDSELARSATKHVGVWQGHRTVHWDVRPNTPASDDVWFVHVHGLGAAPSSTLRSVASVREAGHPSTIVSLEASADIDKRSRGMAPEHLQRVVAAIEHAVQQNAARVVVVGWSYGARLALEAAGHRPQVAGAILVSPMFDFVEVFRFVATRQRLQRPLVAAAAFVLSTPVICRLAGIDRPARYGLDLSSAPRTLIFHSRGDATVPLELTRSAVASFPAVELVEFPSGPHTLEWNGDRELFERKIREWLELIQVEGSNRGAR